MSADHAHDAGHSAPSHDLEKKRTRESSEDHGEGHDEPPPPLPSLAMGIALTAVCTTAMTVNVRSQISLLVHELTWRALDLEH